MTHETRDAAAREALVKLMMREIAHTEDPKARDVLRGEMLLLAQGAAEEPEAEEEFKAASGTGAEGQRLLNKPRGRRDPNDRRLERVRGGIVSRRWKGKLYAIRVLDDGYVKFNPKDTENPDGGEVYNSISDVARVIVNPPSNAYNGYEFFNLGPRHGHNGKTYG